jgi:hypothetical protein
MVHTSLRAENVGGCRAKLLNIRPNVLADAEDHRQGIASRCAFLQAVAQAAVIARRDVKADLAHDVLLLVRLLT